MNWQVLINIRGLLAGSGFVGRYTSTFWTSLSHLYTGHVGSRLTVWNLQYAQETEAGDRLSSPRDPALKV